MSDILIVAAHPDDEVLGCGGTIATHVANGDSVNILIIAEGATSRTQNESTPRPSDIKGQARKAARTLGVSDLNFLDYPDNKLDTVPLLDVVKSIESEVSSKNPKVVYTHHGSDLNVDHRIVSQAVVTACRPQPWSSVSCVLAFEVLSSSEWGTPVTGPIFNPNYFKDISQCLDKKLEALKCYDSELREFPHPRSLRSVETLARLRGSNSGVEAAEAFELLFHLS